MLFFKSLENKPSTNCKLIKIEVSTKTWTQFQARIKPIKRMIVEN